MVRFMRRYYFRVTLPHRVRGLRHPAGPRGAGKRSEWPARGLIDPIAGNAGSGDRHRSDPRPEWVGPASAGGIVVEIWPGTPYPLGATFDGSGTNFALFSEVAERVELCLIDTGDGGEVEE